MKRNAQASLEYIFMVAIALIMIFIFIRKFFDPRFGTIHRTGELQDSIESKISQSMENEINN